MRLREAAKAYWEAKTPEQERAAYRAMREAGAPAAYGEAESWKPPVIQDFDGRWRAVTQADVDFLLRIKDYYHAQRELMFVQETDMQNRGNMVKQIFWRGPP